jgi:parallel beta-helix repeat protein
MTIKKTTENSEIRMTSSQIPSSVWRWDNHKPGGVFRAAATNGKIIIAVGDKGLISTTEDGINWVDGNSRQNKNLYAITYSPPLELFVAVGYKGVIIMSPNGIDWTVVIPGGDAPGLKGITYGAKKFVAVGLKGTVKISNDGKNWINVDIQAKYELNDVHYADGLFVAPSVTNNIFISKDGESWQRKDLGSPRYNLYGVTYGKGTWMVGGAHGQCYTSDDGENWTKRDTQTGNYFHDIVFTGREFIANGNSDGYPEWGSMILVSPDGIRWKREKAPSGFNPGNVPCYSTLITNICFGKRVYALGARQEIISKDIESSGPDIEIKNITITSPKKGENWQAGSTRDITWTSTGNIPFVTLEYSPDNGNTWIVFDANAKNDGHRSWIVPDTPSSQCKIRISEVDNPAVVGTTGGSFSISAPSQPPQPIPPSPPESPSSIVPVGTNTISKAVRDMKQGDVVELGVGTYTQTEPIVLPGNVSRFSIKGKGMGSTIIECLNCNGIQQMESRIHQCDISGMTLIAAKTGGDHIGIKLLGNTHNHVQNPNIILRDISFTAGSENNYWQKAVNIINAFDPLLENIFARGTHSLKGVGIELQSCVVASILGGELCQLDEAINLVKAPDELINDPSKHGCEGIKITNVDIYIVNKGITFGEKTLNIMVNNCNIDPVKKYAIYEQKSILAGYHVIIGGWYGFSKDAEKWGHLLWLQNSGSLVNGIIANGSKTDTNGLTLSAHSQGKNEPVNMIRVIGCIFRNMTSGIYLHNGRDCILSGNICENTKNGIFIGKDSKDNKITGNIGPITGPDK